MLNTDSQGFILGELRLKQIKQGVENTEDNTKEILDFLKSEFKRMIDANQSQSDSLNRTIQDYIKQNKKAKDAASQSNSQNTPNNAEPNQNTGNQRGTPNRASSGRSRNADSNAPSTRPRPSRDAEDPNPNPTRRTRTRSQAEERAQLERERSNQDRDSKGRFTAKDKTILEKFKDLFKNGGGSSGNVDTKGYDPTVDALNELKEIVSPVGNIFGKMTSRAIGILRGRMRKNRNEQTLPEEQQQANRREQESDKERNKLLKRLIDAVRSNGGGGGGLFGGLLGKLFKGGKGLFKGLLKRVPLLGLLFGGASLFSEWGKLDSGGKGKGIGSLAGGALGAILGSVFGPLGTIGGGALGAYLGGIFGKKVGEWTDTLKNSDFVGIFKSLWSDAIGKIVDIAESIKNSKIVKNTKEAVGSGIDYIKQGASNLYNKVTGNKSKGNAASGGSGVSGVDLLSYGQGGGYISPNVGYDANAKGAVGKSSAERQLATYNALRKKFTHEQALAMIGEVGRENGFGDIMFSTHTDPAKDEKGRDILNGGMFSWNRGRYANFQKFMRNRGLMDAKGNMPHTQAVLDAQAEFAYQEMNSKNYKGKLKNFFDNPNQDPKKAAVPLAKYIGWARGQTTIKGKHGRIPFNSKIHENRVNQYIDSTAKLVANKYGKTPNSQTISNQSKALQTNTKGKDVIPLPQQTVGQNKSKMVTPKSSKDLATFAQNAEMPISSKILNPNVTPKTKSILQMNRMQSSNITKVQPIAAERVPLSTGNKVPVMTAQAQDSNINQNVSDRGLAHIFSGGIGFKTLQG